jgi:hypothetical protein
MKINDFGNFFIANKIKDLSDISDAKFILPKFEKARIEN